LDNINSSDLRAAVDFEQTSLVENVHRRAFFGVIWRSPRKVQEAKGKPTNEF